MLTAQSIRVGCRCIATTSTAYAYKQGQYTGKSREYFYYIDHNGQLFMDDARMKNFTSCFKDKKFLDFFFARVRQNQTGRYEDEFPYVSPCGREMNYIRCDDRPIVFTQLNKDQELWHICNSNRTYPFTPTKLCMLPNGRLYHTAPMDNYGLVKSALADELFPRFVFDDSGNPTHFRWREQLVELENELLQFAGKPRRQ